MIFPGRVEKSDLKITLSLATVIIGLNILVFIFSNIFLAKWPAETYYKDLQSKNFNQSLSLMYLQTLDPVEARPLKDLEALQLVALAIKDHRFWSKSQTFPFVGDQLQIQNVRSVMAGLKRNYQESVQQFGLGPTPTSPWAWITYQFTHYSLIHLLSNLLFLFLVINFLEKKVDSSWLAAVYILGGIGGGASFLLFNSRDDLSVIGASGSVCALLGFLLVVMRNRTMPWTYFFAPIPKGYGTLYLPAFLVFPVYLMADFTSMLWEPAGIASSVAHSAHIGGTLVGMALGSLYLVQSFFRSKAASHGILSDDDGLNELL